MSALGQKREFTEIGGLVSYGHDLVDGYGQMGVYAGRILNGSDYSAVAFYYRRRGDRVIEMMSAIGPKRTSLATAHVRFRG